MQTVEPRYAAEHFPALLEAVRDGAEILVVDNGRPVARIVPVRDDDESWDEEQVPWEEVEQAFYGD
ncbi:MAG: type II toxin-antitoxin system prevent-host-death family antitoxin [Chromatiaceae bacterium]|jgi:prevent-host-death family protein